MLLFEVVKDFLELQKFQKRVSRIQWNFGYKIQTKRFAECGGGQIWDNTASYNTLCHKDFRACL